MEIDRESERCSKWKAASFHIEKSLLVPSSQCVFLYLAPHEWDLSAFSWVLGPTMCFVFSLLFKMPYTHFCSPGLEHLHVFSSRLIFSYIPSVLRPRSGLEEGFNLWLEFSWPNVSINRFQKGKREQLYDISLSELCARQRYLPTAADLACVFAIHSHSSRFEFFVRNLTLF